jgi:RsiW-degrading membrane proteinase PrsW (M82 family)
MLDLLLLAIAPSVFLFLFIYAKDRYEPEPLHLVLRVFLLGCLSVIPAGLLEAAFPDGVITSAVVAPVVEETCKFLVVFLVVWRHAEFNEPVDGIIYATAAGLGFATVENILYVLEGGLAVGILRAFLSVPGHVVFACIWGAALGIAKFRPGRQQAGIILAGLLGGMLLHGMFNFSIGVLGLYGFLVLLVLVPAGIWWTVRNIRTAHADPASACSAYASMYEPQCRPENTGTGGSTGIVPQNGPATGPATGFCTACGAPLHEGNAICEQCGKRL